MYPRLSRRAILVDPFCCVQIAPIHGVAAALVRGANVHLWQREVYAVISGNHSGKLNPKSTPGTKPVSIPHPAIGHQRGPFTGHTSDVDRRRRVCCSSVMLPMQCRRSAVSVSTSPSRIRSRQPTCSRRYLPLSAVLAAKGEAPKIPALIRWLLKFRMLRNIPARIIGYGFDREDVDGTDE